MSRVKDGAQIRKERIALLMEIVDKMPDATENRIKGQFMLRTGLTIRTITEMVDECIIAEILKREGDKLLSNI